MERLIAGRIGRVAVVTALVGGLAGFVAPQASSYAQTAEPDAVCPLGGPAPCLITHSNGNEYCNLQIVNSTILFNFTLKTPHRVHHGGAHILNAMQNIVQNIPVSVAHVFYSALGARSVDGGEVLMTHESDATLSPVTSNATIPATNVPNAPFTLTETGIAIPDHAGPVVGHDKLVGSTSTETFNLYSGPVVMGSVSGHLITTVHGSCQAPVMTAPPPDLASVWVHP